jgi:NADPH:quinone reductase
LVKLDGQHNSNASATDPANVPSLYSYLTSLHALKYRANLQKGETLLVLGASGGVGSTAIQIGKNLGATIIAAASTEEKCETCKRLGADYTINYDKENLKLRVREITKQKNGVNVVFDPVGDRYCDPAVRSLAWHGRYVVIGFAAGTIPRVAVNLLLLKEASILGSALRESGMHDPTGSKREREELLQMFHDGKIVPFVSTVLPLEKAADALTLFQDRKVRGKVVLVTRAYEEKYGRPWKGIVRRGKL